MTKPLAFFQAMLVAGATALFGHGVWAQANGKTAAPIEVVVKMGTYNDPLIYEPNALVFETGKTYRLVLLNEGPSPHHFVSPGFAKAINTLQVDTFDREGKLAATVYGGTDSIKLHGKTKAHWTFTPHTKSELTDWVCSVAGHAEHGMKGTIRIE
ncbi:MAG: hypothetical protein R3194_08975 [Limnobacter sp.]|nr:hypothetical protein [Limnobacter sp.]